MGPRLDNRGWARVLCPIRKVPDASMGPRLDNRGWAWGHTILSDVDSEASMGPRLDNRAWAQFAQVEREKSNTLQWVHGWITVVGPRAPALHRPVRPGFNGSTVG